MILQQLSGWFISRAVISSDVVGNGLILSKRLMGGELPLTAITLSCAIDNLGRLSSLDHT